MDNTPGYAVILDSARLDQKYGPIEDGAKHYVAEARFWITEDIHYRNVLVTCACGVSASAQCQTGDFCDIARVATARLSCTPVARTQAGFFPRFGMSRTAECAAPRLSAEFASA